MHAADIKKLYSCKYDEKLGDFRKKIKLPNRADCRYV